MKLSAPIHILKSKAKSLKRTQNLTLTEALDIVAKEEGFSSWSLLMAKSENIFPKSREEILAYLNPCDLLLIGARPGQGKTTFTLQILLQAIGENRSCYFFSLEYTRKDVAAKLASIEPNMGEWNSLLSFDFSDEISATYIIEKLKGKELRGSLIGIDYLQLLDQKRSHPELQIQIEDLKKFAKETGCIFIFISQIDRTFEATGRSRPTLEDIRLPNPVDLKLFDKKMFLHNGKKIFTSPTSFEID